MASLEQTKQKSITDSLIASLAVRFIKDYNISDPGVARLVGEEAARIIETNEASPNPKLVDVELPKSALQRVAFDSTFVDNFDDSKIHKLIEFLESRVPELALWPVGFGLHLHCEGDWGDYQDLSSPHLLADVQYRDVNGKSRKRSDDLGRVDKIDLIAKVGAKLDLVASLVKMCGKMAP